VVSLGIFSVVPPTEPCALRLTQLLKVSTRDFSWGKGGRCAWLTNYHPCSAETSRKSGALTYREPRLSRDTFTLYIYIYIYIYILLILTQSNLSHMSGSINVNLLKTKRNLLYIRHQTVPRCKHFPPRL